MEPDSGEAAEKRMPVVSLLAGKDLRPHSNIIQISLCREQELWEAKFCIHPPQL